MTSKPRVVFLAGPTAIGKSDTGCLLAKKLKAEIISCDSMQVYRGMDIVTSQPGPRQQRAIAHHLLGVVPAAKEFNVTRYRRMALKCMRDIISRGKIPLFVGGTGLYMSIIVDGIFRGPKADEKLRARLDRQDNARLYARLQKADPEAALKIHPNDRRRIIRALEVYLLSGKKISELQKQRRGISAGYDVRMFCLSMPLAKLYKRINARVEQMFARGLETEVRGLLGKELSRTAFSAIGLKELKAYFDGDVSLLQAKEMIKRNTRQYARRQLTWFRKDRHMQWVSVSNKKPAQIAELIYKRLRKVT